VRYTGASNTAAWRLEEARCLAREFGTEASYYCCVQQRYSYVRPQAGAIYDPHVYVNEEFLDYARTRDLTILAYSPLLGSAYQREDRDFPEQYKGPDTDTRMGVIREVAEETEATPNQLVLAWMLQSDPPVIPVIGGSSVAQLEELLDALEVELSLEQLERLSKAGNKPATHSNAQRQTPDGAKQG
jgi:aryl-alcohol dehydrogenase-like predicted oxidoreductase